MKLIIITLFVFFTSNVFAQSTLEKISKDSSISLKERERLFLEEKVKLHPEIKKIINNKEVRRAILAEMYVYINKEDVDLKPSGNSITTFRVMGIRMDELLSFHDAKQRGENYWTGKYNTLKFNSKSPIEIKKECNHYSLPSYKKAKDIAKQTDNEFIFSRISSNLNIIHQKESIFFNRAEDSKGTEILLTPENRVMGIRAKQKYPSNPGIETLKKAIIKKLGEPLDIYVAENSSVLNYTSPNSVDVALTAKKRSYQTILNNHFAHDRINDTFKIIITSNSIEYEVENRKEYNKYLSIIEDCIAEHDTEYKNFIDKYSVEFSGL